MWIANCGRYQLIINVEQVLGVHIVQKSASCLCWFVTSIMIGLVIFIYKAPRATAITCQFSVHLSVALLFHSEGKAVRALLVIFT